MNTIFKTDVGTIILFCFSLLCSTTESSSFLHYNFSLFFFFPLLTVKFFLNEVFAQHVAYQAREKDHTSDLPHVVGIKGLFSPSYIDSCTPRESTGKSVTN